MAATRTRTSSTHFADADVPFSPAPNGSTAAVAVVRQSVVNGEGIERQRKWAQRQAAADERTITRELADDGRGATVRSKGGSVRESLVTLMELIESGEYGAVYATEPSRISRNVRVFRKVLDACALHGVALTFKPGAGINYVPGDKMSKFMCDIVAMLADLEAATMNERMMAATADRRERGVSLSRKRSFGWMDYTRKQLHPTESVAVLAVVGRLLSGATVASCVRWLNSEDYKTTTGGEWTETTLRNYLTNPALAGWATQLGENGRPQKVCKPTAESDMWVPLISETEHSLIVAMFAQRQRGRRFDSYPLTGLMQDCNGKPMVANKTSYGRRYRTDQRHAASTGYIAMYADPVEQAVLEAVSSLLRRRSLASLLDDQTGAATALEAAQREQARAEAAYSEWMAWSARLDSRERQLAESSRLQLRRELEQADAAIADAMNLLRTHSVLAKYETSEALCAALATMEHDELAAVYAELISAVVIGPAESKALYDDSKRVDIQWSAAVGDPAV